MFINRRRITRKLTISCTHPRRAFDRWTTSTRTRKPAPQPKKADTPPANAPLKK